MRLFGLEISTQYIPTDQQLFHTTEYYHNLANEQQVGALFKFPHRDQILPHDAIEDDIAAMYLELSTCGLERMLTELGQGIRAPRRFATEPPTETRTRHLAQRMQTLQKHIRSSEPGAPDIAELKAGRYLMGIASGALDVDSALIRKMTGSVDTTQYKQVS